MSDSDGWSGNQMPGPAQKQFSPLPRSLFRHPDAVSYNWRNAQSGQLGDWKLEIRVASASFYGLASLHPTNHDRTELS